MKRFSDSNFHLASHGRLRNSKWSPMLCNVIQLILWDLLLRFLLENIPFFQKELKKLALDVSYFDIQSIFQAWN
jgi:hypothetical protein